MALLRGFFMANYKSQPIWVNKWVFGDPSVGRCWLTKADCVRIIACIRRKTCFSILHKMWLWVILVAQCHIEKHLLWNNIHTQCAIYCREHIGWLIHVKKHLWLNISKVTSCRENWIFSYWEAKSKYLKI